MEPIQHNPQDQWQISFFKRATSSLARDKLGFVRQCAVFYDAKAAWNF
jgi:hypothetical protein